MPARPALPYPNPPLHPMRVRIESELAMGLEDELEHSKMLSCRVTGWCDTPSSSTWIQHSAASDGSMS